MHLLNKISEDGSKIFALGFGHIQTVSTNTGKDVGHMEFSPANGSFLYVVLKWSSIHAAGDGTLPNFGGQKMSDFGEFPDPPYLDLVDESTGGGRVGSRTP